MKNSALLLILFVCSVFGHAQQKQNETKVMIGTYDGHTEKGYYFTDNAEERIFNFTKTEQGALKGFDLEKETFIGRRFRVTYRINLVETPQKEAVKQTKSEETKLYKKEFVLVSLEEQVEKDE